MIIDETIEYVAEYIAQANKSANCIKNAEEYFQFEEWLKELQEYKNNYKQAKWLINSDGYYPYCSNCGKEPDGRKMSKYCPDCGVRMDGDKDV